MDETWIHHHTPESNLQSAEWTVAGEPRPKRPKSQKSAGKVMASVFWDVQGILFIDYLEKGKRINSEYYMALLVRLKEEITKKTTSHEEEKSALSPRQCTVSQVDRNDGQIARIGLQIASTPPLFSSFGSQLLLPVRRPEKNARRKEI
jgi:hypothetical protein